MIRIQLHLELISNRHFFQSLKSLGCVWPNFENAPSKFNIGRTENEHRKVGQIVLNF